MSAFFKNVQFFVEKPKAENVCFSTTSWHFLLKMLTKNNIFWQKKIPNIFQPALSKIFVIWASSGLSHTRELRLMNRIQLHRLLSQAELQESNYPSPQSPSYSHAHFEVLDLPLQGTCVHFHALWQFTHKAWDLFRMQAIVLILTIGQAYGIKIGFNNGLWQPFCMHGCLTYE